MKIRAEIEVFDDPEYCEANGKECAKIKKEYVEELLMDVICTVYDCDCLAQSGRLVKCDQCKTDYQETVKKQINTLKSLQWMTGGEAEYLEKLKFQLRPNISKN